ncbi:MAG: hypothetical protein IJZ79_01520 [Bacilli bacterium]|nr:hypothetical protein [Bacilli bacterium]
MENNDLSTVKEIDTNKTLTAKSDVLSHTKKMLVKLRFLFIIVAIICFAKVGMTIYTYHISQMPTSHVFVCDNPNAEFRSDFDLWIKDELGITWVPTYVIIQDGYVVGAFEGNIDEYDFTDKLAMAASFNIPFSPVPDYEIENLDGERLKASDVFGGPGLYVLEISWIDCEDCMYQDEHFTDKIYETYSTNNFYRYYVLSDRVKVENYYEK